MVTRRAFLAGAAGAGLWTSLGVPGLALAAAPTEQRFLLVVLRGGLDGLAAFPPYGDPDYAASHAQLAIAPAGKADGAIDLDGRFGLHPALRPLQTLYRREEMLVIHAVAIAERTRSHFDAQDVLESGAQRAHGMTDGWLNRALQLIHGSEARLGLAVGYAVPAVLRGKTPVSSWAPARLPPSPPDILDKLAVLYRDDPVLSQALVEGRTAQRMNARVLGSAAGMDRGNLRNPGQFRKLATAAGRLMADANGPRVGVIDMGGWDTHANQGNANGRLARNLGLLAEGLAALPETMGPAWRRTVVTVVTEFGRTVRMNGSRGTDHGTAGAAFLLGGAVAGGRVATRWPGLSADALYEGRDLAPTSDLRALFKAVLGQHMGVAADALETAVFPGSTAAKAPPGRPIRA